MREIWTHFGSYSFQHTWVKNASRKGSSRRPKSQQAFLNLRQNSFRNGGGLAAGFIDKHVNKVPVGRNLVATCRKNANLVLERRTPSMLDFEPCFDEIRVFQRRVVAASALYAQADRRAGGGSKPSLFD